MPRTQSQVQIRHRQLPQYDADIRVSDGSDHPARNPFTHLAGFELRTGAATVQTYMCASECRALAKALTAAAMRLELATDEAPAVAAEPAPAPATAHTSQAPAIGQFWPSQGGIYAGVVRGTNGAPDQHLIFCNEARPATTLAWRAALDWAQGLKVHGFADWSAPSRPESALLYSNLRSKVGAGWAWTAEEYDGSYAWYQYFSCGTQYDGHKSAEGRAVAVRRIDVQSFHPSRPAGDPDTAERADVIARLLQPGSM